MSSFSGLRRTMPQWHKKPPGWPDAKCVMRNLASVAPRTAVTVSHGPHHDATD